MFFWYDGSMNIPIEPKGMLRPQLDFRDRDFLRSFHPAISFGAGAVPQFPPEYDTDAGLWMPNQSAINPEFPNTGPQPYGCTNYTQSDLAADLDGKLHDPAAMEQATGANAAGGYDIRQSLLAAKRLGLITGFYNVQAYAPLDFFDALRLAAFSGLPEKRSVSMGTPWYSEWQAAAVGATKNPDGTFHYSNVMVPRPIMPMPSSLKWEGLSWHNWKIGGWKLINGVPYLKGKPWEGKNAGDNGWIYFNRATINAVMALKYTIAFTATHAKPKTTYTVDTALFDKWMQYLQKLIGLRY